jgi:hypothetical protein
MLVVVPPMIIGLTVPVPDVVDEDDVDDEEAVDDEDDEDDEEAVPPPFAALVFEAFLKSLSVASAPATRFVSSLSDAELVAGLTVGEAEVVVAPAEVVSTAAATAAATPAAATGRTMRMRRLCRPLRGRGVDKRVPHGAMSQEGRVMRTRTSQRQKAAPRHRLTEGGLLSYPVCTD